MLDKSKNGGLITSLANTTFLENKIVSRKASSEK